ncbi:Wzz/FepE/Etk N-terminal domain-containing protein [Rhabdochromatium marinum]|uniref:Wzz/FepE/Etk N-terminal domain-containing protein n=1 Tax=Rhabdochromatium marinum TaxID=48729 RepID=UPI001906F24F|nr:Wzz/FepE/Etk N-terminal domain-containing protein [Rhabdochromatium marinum]MBK1647120.1 lipopolysaccharide biosynthesis protein [Rhabdochromatium marinum]
MEEHVLTLDDYLAILKRRKWQLIIPAVLLSIIGLITAVILPPTYRSTATILIEQQEIPDELVRSTVTSYAAQRVQTISQRVMTTENLGKIIESYHLYPDLMQRYGLVSAVDQMREDIKLDMISADVIDPRSGRPSEATIAFSLSYENESPNVAQRVANDITSLFLSENLKDRQQSAKDTASFLQKEANKLADKLGRVEAQLAQFKQEHGDSLPELKSLNLQLIQRTEERLRDTDQAIRTLKERKIYLEGQLAQIDPFSELFSVDGRRVLGPADRLKALEAEYATVAARYSSQHPDRMRIEREIATLRQQVGQSENVTAELERALRAQQEELADLRERYSNEHPDVKALTSAITITQRQLAKARRGGAAHASSEVIDADNPAYIQLQAQLQAAEAELQSLQNTREQTQAKLTTLEERIAKGPSIELEYQALTRDHENTIATYREVKQRLMAAELGEALETERKGERFSLIEPPRLPEQPAKPNRLAIAFLGFVLAFGGGVGNLALQEVLDRSVHNTRDLEAIIMGPPLAVIPFIETEADVRRRTRYRLIAVLGSILGLTLATAAVHYFVKPLDILWIKVLDRAGLLHTETPNAS